MPPREIWWMVAGGVVTAYAVSFVVIYCGLSLLLEETTPQ